MATAMRHISATAAREFEVTSITLDDYFQAASRLERVDLMKIDIEGLELPALKGARQDSDEG